MRYILPIMLALASPALAHEKTVGDLEISHASIPDPTPLAMSAAGYMAISNNGETPEELIGVRTPFAKSAKVHETIMDGDVAMMRAIDGLTIPPGETVNLEPGGLHVMFMGLTGPADAGDMIPATLIFRNAGDVEIEFMVEPTDEMDHSGMDHSGMETSGN